MFQSVLTSSPVHTSNLTMVIINASLRLLRSFSRQTNHRKHYNKTICCTLFHYTNSGVPVAYQVPLSEHRRSYAEWSPNIVKSPYENKEIPEALITDSLWSHADNWSELTAVVCGITERELKYKELKLLSRKLATSLLKKGFKSGDVIAIILPNMPEFPIITLGILEAEFIITTLNPLYTADEIAYQINNSKAVAIFTIPEKLNAVLEAKKILEENKDYTSNLKVICTNDVLGNETEVPSDVDQYSSLIGDDVDDSLLPSLRTGKVTTHDVAVIPYSSGTTGRPKGVCLTHRNIIAGILSMRTLGDVEDAINGKQEIIPCILPGFHIYGLTAILLQSFFSGAKVVTLPKFEEKSFLHIMKKYEFTVLYVAPPLIIYIGSSPNVTEEHLRSVKVVVSGAAPVADSDIEKCVKKSPPGVLYKQGYGLTEVTGGISIMEKGIKKYSSVGILAINSYGKVIDLETFQALGPKQEGEICVKSPQIMKCYLNNEKATNEVIDSDGWFHTGDIGYYDEQNHFYITDRLKELIKVKGFQVAPAELEGILRSHPEVEDAGVVGIPDPRKGESPIGFVKIKKDAKVTEEELKAFLAPKVANYKRIDRFVFVDSIPISASGKILRKDLKESYLKNISS